MRLPVLLGLGAATAAAVAAAVWAVGLGAGGPPERLGERLLPDLARRAEEVATIEIRKPEFTVVIARDGEAWRLPERAGYAADTAKVRQLFVELAGLRTLEAKTRSKDLYPSLDVEDRDAPGAKSTLVALRDAQGRDVVAILAGKARYGRGGGGEDAVYVRLAGESQAWLAKGRLTVNRDAVQWLDRIVAEVARERVREAEVRQADGTTLVVRREKPSDKDFTPVDAPADRKLKSAWDVNSVAGAFDKLELDDARRAADLPVPADAPATTITTFDGLTVTARFLEKDGETWVALEASAAPPDALPEGGEKLKDAAAVREEAQRINARASPWVYRLPKYVVDSMRRRMDDLLEPKAS
jgi:hypothetical protein